MLYTLSMYNVFVNYTSIKLEGQKRKAFWGYSGCKVPMVQRRSFAESRWEFAWGCGGWGGWLSKGTEKFWSYLIELMVPQTYAKTHQVVHLNIYSSRYINYTSINLKYFRGIKKDLVLQRKKSYRALSKQDGSSTLEVFARKSILTYCQKPGWNEWYLRRSGHKNTNHPFAHVLITKRKTYEPHKPGTSSKCSHLTTVSRNVLNYF